MDCCLLFPGLVACTTRAEYSRAKIVGLDPSEQPAHSIYPAPQGQLSAFEEPGTAYCFLPLVRNLPSATLWAPSKSSNLFPISNSGCFPSQHQKINSTIARSPGLIWTGPAENAAP